MVLRFLDPYVHTLSQLKDQFNLLEMIRPNWPGCSYSLGRSAAENHSLAFHDFLSWVCRLKKTVRTKTRKKARASTMAKRQRKKKKKYLSPKEIEAKLMRLPAR